VSLRIKDWIHPFNKNFDKSIFIALEMMCKYNVHKNTFLKKEKQELEDMMKKKMQAFEEEKKYIFIKILTLKKKIINLQVEQTTLQIKRNTPLSHVNSMSHLVQQNNHMMQSNI